MNIHIVCCDAYLSITKVVFAAIIDTQMLVGTHD